MKKVVGLEIRKNGWTAVEFKATKRKAPEVLSCVGGRWNSSDDPVSRGMLLTKVFTERKMSRKNIILSLPLELGYWKRLTLPALPSSSLETAVRTGLEVEAPWPGEELVLGFREWKIADNKIEVESFICPKRVLTEQQLILEAAGLSGRYFSPRVYGVVNCFLLRNRDLPAFQGSLVLLEFTSTETEISVFDKQGIILLRSFPNPITTEGGCDQELLAEELKLTRFMLRKLQGAYPKRCYILGYASGLDQESLSLIARDLGFTENQTSFSPKHQLFSGLSSVNKDLPGVFSTAGLALEGLGLVPPGLTLSPPPSEKKQAKARVIVWSLLVVGFLSTLGGLIFRHNLLQKEEALLKNWLMTNQKEVAELRRLLTEQQIMEEKLIYYSDLRKSQLIIPNFFAEWERVIPPQTAITALSLDGKQVNRLSGYTPSFSLLYQKVLNSPYLKALQVREGITSSPDGMEVFQLSGRLGDRNETTKED